MNRTKILRRYAKALCVVKSANGQVVSLYNNAGKVKTPAEHNVTMSKVDNLLSGMGKQDLMDTWRACGGVTGKNAEELRYKIRTAISDRGGATLRVDA